MNNLQKSESKKNENTIEIVSIHYGKRSLVECMSQIIRQTKESFLQLDQNKLL